MDKPMDKRFARGLVVGKFAPLHRGHMHLIQSAIDACARRNAPRGSRPCSRR